MANINFGLLDTQYPEKLANAFVRSPEQQNANMLQAMQMQQLMDQREQAQYALGKSRREETGMAEFGNAIKALGPDPSLLAIAQVFMKHPNPEYQLKGFELQKQAQDSDRYARANAPAPAPAPGPAFGGVAPTTPAPGSFGADVATRKAQLFGPPPDRTNMMPGAAVAPAEVNNLPAAFTPPQVKTQLDFLRERIDANLALRTDQGYKTAENLQKQLTELNRRYPVGNALMGPEGNVFGTAPEKPPAPPSMVAEYTFAKTPDGGGFRGSFQDFVKERAAAARPPAQPRPEQPAQPVIDPDNPGKIILVSREEAIRRRMTPANTVEKPMTEAQRVRYDKDKVSDKDVVTGAFAVTGELEKLTDELVGNPDKKIAPAPGLNSITGYSALTNPLALPKGDARKALQKLDTFKGKIMALGRQLASQEGKLGNMAVQEWKFVSDAVQKLDPAAGNLDEQMRDVVRQSKQYALRQQTKYNDTYADDSTAPPAASPGKWGKAVAE